MNDDDREQLLAALLRGERTPTDPQVAARLAADPQLAADFERLQRTAAAVAAAGAEQRDVLAAARRSEDRAFADAVQAAVQRAVGERQRSRRRLRLLVGAAALAAAVLLGWFLWQRAPVAPANLLLGSDDRLEPRGPVDGTYSPFTWPMPLPPGGRFELRIYDVVDGRKGTLRYPSSPVNVTSPWRLTADAEASLPREIYWEIEVIGGDQPEILHAHAWRR